MFRNTIPIIHCHIGYPAVVTVNKNESRANEKKNKKYHRISAQAFSCFPNLFYFLFYSSAGLKIAAIETFCFVRMSLTMTTMTTMTPTMMMMIMMVMLMMMIAIIIIVVCTPLIVMVRCFRVEMVGGVCARDERQPVVVEGKTHL